MANDFDALPDGLWVKHSDGIIRRWTVSGEQEEGIEIATEVGDDHREEKPVLLNRNAGKMMHYTRAAVVPFGVAFVMSQQVLVGIEHVLLEGLIDAIVVGGAGLLVAIVRGRTWNR